MRSMGYIIAFVVLAAVIFFFRWCHQQRTKTSDPHEEEREPKSGIETLAFLLVAHQSLLAKILRQSILDDKCPT